MALGLLADQPGRYSSSAQLTDARAFDRLVSCHPPPPPLPSPFFLPSPRGHEEMPPSPIPLPPPAITSSSYTYLYSVRSQRKRGFEPPMRLLFPNTVPHRQLDESRGGDPSFEICPALLHCTFSNRSSSYPTNTSFVLLPVFLDTHVSNGSSEPRIVSTRARSARTG